jgi:CheY-like chemotaxis protein
LILTRLLKKHKLDVDTSASAEEALSYLAGHRPDVIFMDHLMPGMDGFQALQAIKNNPQTATIPIMMYTSQAGDLYVGQARALGAVGVLPKQTRQVEISNVLRSLNLAGEEGDEEEEEYAESAAEAAQTLQHEDESLREALAAEEASGAGAEARLKAHLDRRLRDQLTALKREVDLGLDTWAGKLGDSVATQIEMLLARIESEAPQRRRHERARRFGLLSVITAVLVALVLGALLGVSYRGRLEEGSRAQIAIQRTQQESLAETLGAGAAGGGGDEAAYELAVAALQWGANQGSGYPFGEPPLDDARAETLSQLVEQLRAIGFEGTVRLETHVGDFCMLQTPDGGWQQAPSDRAVEACDRTGWTEAEALALGERQSVRFANLLRFLNRGDGPRIEVVSLGNSTPLADYPASPGAMTAGEWNAVARLNNRVETYLIPAPGSR